MMSIKTKKTRLLMMLFTLLSFAIVACGGGGGGGGGGTTRPVLEVQPAKVEFNPVTEGKTASPIDVSIINSGTASLSVSSMTISGADSAFFDIVPGTCVSTAPAIAASSSCNIKVLYSPAANSFGLHSATLTIQSNDPTNPNLTMALTGEYTPVTDIVVKITQVLACTRPGTARVYVSVTDQEGYAVAGLTDSAFKLFEDGSTSETPFTFSNVAEASSVALLMDYSGSIYVNGNRYRYDMENAATAFVDKFRPGFGDAAEIVKFASTFQVMRHFTTDTGLLKAAILNFPNFDDYGTLLNDTIFRSLERTSAFNNPPNKRKAIIVMTDGKDDDGTGTRLSTRTLDVVIEKSEETGIPVFTVGVAAADTGILQDLADDTGGTFFGTLSSSNLPTIYQQLADLVLGDPYVLTYNSALLADQIGSLKVEVRFGSGLDEKAGEYTKVIPVCQ